MADLSDGYSNSDLASLLTGVNLFLVISSSSSVADIGSCLFSRSPLSAGDEVEDALVEGSSASVGGSLRFVVGGIVVAITF